jgi:GWxTD domain-containing protein
MKITQLISAFRLPLVIALCAMASYSASAQFDLTNSLSLNSTVFFNLEKGPYVETCVNIHGKGLRFAKLGMDEYKSEVLITLILKKENEVIDFLKYKLESPVVSDTSQIEFSLMDQKRMLLSEEGLQLEILVEDLHNSKNQQEKTIALDYSFESLPAFSDLLLIDTFHNVNEQGPFVKNGLRLMPYAINFYPTDRTKLIWYYELYGTELMSKSSGEEQFLITGSIRNRNSEEVNPNFWQYYKQTANPVLVSLLEFDITQLPSGNYDLVMELRNSKNEVLLEKRKFFQRLNMRGVESAANIAMMDVDELWVDKYDQEQLDAFLNYLKPSASPSEQNLIVSIEDLPNTEMKKRFLYNYWLKRSPENSYGKWLEYLGRVKKSNEMFPTISKQGYRTDRGRVMLKYGIPNDIQSQPSEPGAYPYEIWHFYNLEDGQANIQFIFYEPTLISDDYKLLHSNALGELQDPRWKLTVYENVADPSLINDPDATGPEGHFGGGAGLFEDNFGGNRTNGGGP